MERRLSENRVSLSINLREIYGRRPTAFEKREFAELARDLIIDRTQSGKDFDGQGFPAYKADYAEFKGVSRNSVDLTLFGDMLNSIDYRTTENGVEIFIDDDKQAAKAHGHITGFEKHSIISKAKGYNKKDYQRDFFGITKDEARDIAEQVRVVESEPVLQGLATPELIGEVFGNQVEINIDAILGQIFNGET
jgi:hypothetical protein